MVVILAAGTPGAEGTSAQDHFEERMESRDAGGYNDDVGFDAFNQEVRQLRRRCESRILGEGYVPCPDDKLGSGICTSS